MRNQTRWRSCLIPLSVAIGSPGLLTTLVALSLGASVADIGVMTATAATATIVFSVVWGRLSDRSGRRKRYLLFFSIALGPIFLALSMANAVPQLILLYTLLTGITSGVAPIATTYTAECSQGRNWQGEVAKYNSIMSLGNISGLATYTVLAQFYETRRLFYISSAMCFLSALLLWKNAQETEITLERHPLRARGFHDVEKLLSLKPVLHRLDVRRLKPPKNLKQLKPLQLLFLAAFVHWTGIYFMSVGQTPLMKALGLSDSLILAINTAGGITLTIAFVRIAPQIKSSHKGLLNRVVAVRGGLMLCWAALPVFLFHQVSFVFIFPLAISIAFNICYAIIWLRLTTFAISQAPEGHKGSVQGELLSAAGAANAVGSALGGLAITAYGYTLGFVLAFIIAMLAIPILSRINIT